MSGKRNVTAFIVQAGTAVGDGPLAPGGVGGAFVAVGRTPVFVGVRVGGLEVTSGVTVGNAVGVAGSGVVVTGT